jgi:H+/Cl- antiporter ClcA
MRQLLHSYRRLLTNYESSLAYAALGVVGGIASGLVVLAFELSIRELGRLWRVGDDRGFEALPPEWAFGLPVVGALLLGLCFQLLKPEDREVGIVHVLSRMHSHYGVLPLRNAAVQFLGGAFALASGQAGGREGPGVHLGAAINSLLGQRLGLPHNSLRVLIACGTAGGIAAAFNTPLAGVIFAMEVIVAEYTVAGFIPVILAAVSASAVSRLLAGGTVLFSIGPASLSSLWEIPWVVLLGISCGVAVSAFIFISRQGTRLNSWPLLLRFSLAGLVTGSIALYVPEVLGIGYDTLDGALHGQYALWALLTIAASKLLATSISCGLGLPIGLIGPSLIIGGCLGGALGKAGALFYPELASDQTLYIVIGMAAAMGAVLNAPLAAILAVIELTHTISVGMPALLAVVAATLTNNGVFRQRSAHQTVLRQLQRSVPHDPLNQLLHRTHVTSSMEVSVSRVPCMLDPKNAQPLIIAAPAWCIIQRDSDDLYMVRGQDLAQWLSERAQSDDNDADTDLTAADIRRWTVAGIPVQATLRQAMDTMRTDTVEAVCVYGRGTGGKRVLQGVVTREHIEQFSLSHL